MTITALACPPPLDWCLECEQAMREAGIVYVCERCGSVSYKPEATEED